MYSQNRDQKPIAGIADRKIGQNNKDPDHSSSTAFAFVHLAATLFRAA